MRLVIPDRRLLTEEGYGPPDKRTHEDSQAGKQCDPAEDAIAVESKKRSAHDERPNNKIIAFRFGQHIPRRRWRTPLIRKHQTTLLRPMLLFNHNAVLTAWAGTRLGITDFRPCSTIGVARDGVILAAAIYNNYCPPNIEITFATASPHWASKGAIRAMLRYPFVQLACKRLTAITAAQNTAARTFLLRLGFCEEGLHPDALPTGAAVSHGLLAANAARWIA